MESLQISFDYPLRGKQPYRYDDPYEPAVPVEDWEVELLKNYAIFPSRVMARSLKVASQYIQKVKLALQRNNYPSQKALAEDIGISLSTVKNFLSGKPVDYLNFVEISEKLGLTWQEIADAENPPTPLPENPSPFVTGSPTTEITPWS